MKNILCVITLALLLFSTKIFAAEFTATIDRNSLSENETFRLMLTLNGATTDAEPDLAPLLSDFTLLSTAKSTQVSMVNQQKTSQVEWTLDLAPKGSGTFILPAISLGAYTSKPISLTVNKASATQRVNQDKIFLEVSARPQDPYVSGQVLYTVKLYYSVPFENASLTDPVVNNAVIKRLQDDFTYRTVFHHGKYAVLERHYAIFPQTTDPLTIEPPQFIADLLRGGQSSAVDIFFSGRGDTIRLSGKPITLQVHPKPAEISSGEWLPAEDVKITEDWSVDAFPLQVGKPITRTLHILARGVSGELLPSLAQHSKTAAFSVYPDAPVIKTETDGKGLVSERTEKIVLIPTQGGDVELPEITVSWWNTILHRTEVAHLPARVLSIAASPVVKTAASSPAISVPPFVLRPSRASGRAAVSKDEKPVSSAAFEKVAFSVPPFVKGGVGGIFFLVLFSLVRKYFFRPKRKAPDDELPPLFLNK